VYAAKSRFTRFNLARRFPRAQRPHKSKYVHMRSDTDISITVAIKKLLLPCVTNLSYYDTAAVKYCRLASAKMKTVYSL